MNSPIETIASVHVLRVEVPGELLGRGMAEPFLSDR
jgi:hypothetical protein